MASLHIMIKIYCFLTVGSILLMLFSCNNSSELSAFKVNPYLNDNEARLILNDQGYVKVPEEISTLNGIRKLTISIDSNKWVVLPPMSALNSKIDYAPENKLTPAISKLESLEVLNLWYLNLTALPANFAELKQLDSLNIGLNSLIISNEIEKLKALKNLRYINIMGNRLDTTQIKRWQAENPKLTIKYKFFD